MTGKSRSFGLVAALAFSASVTGTMTLERPVADAAARGDIETVQDLLRNGADVNTAQGDGMTALHWAAERGDLALAEVLIYSGANVNAGTRIGRYTPLHLASREGLDDLYPTDLARRAMVDSANFFTMSMLYPLVARATYPRLSFSGYPGEVSTSDASDDEKEAARKSAESELPRLLEVYRDFFFTDAGFIGGDSPTIADIRLASTLEFLAVADTELPSWATDYMQRVESALGDAYSEPAADVRGYIAQVTAQPVAS